MYTCILKNIDAYVFVHVFMCIYVYVYVCIHKYARARSYLHVCQHIMFLCMFEQAGAIDNGHSCILRSMCCCCVLLIFYVMLLHANVMM